MREKAKSVKSLSFAKKIVRLREARGWTQFEMSRHMGISQSTICRWETGATVPRGLYAELIEKQLAKVTA